MVHSSEDNRSTDNTVCCAIDHVRVGVKWFMQCPMTKQCIDLFENVPQTNMNKGS